MIFHLCHWNFFQILGNICPSNLSWHNVALGSISFKNGKRATVGASDATLSLFGLDVHFGRPHVCGGAVTAVCLAPLVAPIRICTNALSR